VPFCSTAHSSSAFSTNQYATHTLSLQLAATLSCNPDPDPLAADVLHHHQLEFPMKDRQVWLQSLKERRAGGDASSASSTGGSATGAKKKAKRLSV